MELADLLESYPSAHNSGIQRMVTDKHEFAELASSTTEKLGAGRGQFYNHQKLYQRFMRIYDRLCILDDTGTGKSCAVLGFTELVHKEWIKETTSPEHADQRLAHYRKAVILVRNEHLMNEFKKQLICRCSDGSYETSHLLSAQTQNARTRRANAILEKAGYEMYTYSTFVSYIINKYGTGSDRRGNEMLIADYHHSVFWVDEAHYILDDSERESDLSAGVNKMLSVDVIYKQLWRVFHVVPYTKIFMTTATPMTNSTSSLGPLMNLLIPDKLPLDYDLNLTTENDLRVLFSSYSGTLEKFKRLPREEAKNYYAAQFPSDYQFDSAKLNDIEPRVRGLIAYIRGVDAEAKVVEMGSDYSYDLSSDGIQTKVNMKLFISKMSEFQSLAYKRAKDEDNQAFLPNQRQASMFVYPDGNWRSSKDKKTGYSRYIKTHASSEIKAVITKGKKRRTIREVKTGDFYATREFESAIQVLNSDKTINVESTLVNIEKYGCKYAAAIRLMIQPDNEGNCFVYEEYFTGPGTICFATCLNLLGFERFTGESSAYESVSTSTSEGQSMASYCADPLAGYIRKITLDKRPRYILLSSEVTPVQFSNMIELMNDPLNLHGEYIKVFITSRVGREGLSVFNVTQRHLLGPEWNESNEDQADARAHRVGGHDALIKWKQELYRQKGLDPATAVINIETYHHAAVPNYNEDPNEASDLYMYRYSDAKQRPISRMMRILRQCAVTCQINKGRNTRATDKDYSKECLYDKCQYSCYEYQDETGAVTTGDDYSTYDLVYAQPKVNEIKKEVINVFNQIPALHLDELVLKIARTNGGASLKKPELKKLVLSALEQLIQNKTVVVNRLGYPCYVREDSNRYYLDYSYPDGPAEYDMRHYVEEITMTETTSLPSIVNSAANKNGVMSNVDLSSIDEVRRYFENIEGNTEEDWMKRIAAIEYMIDRKEHGEQVPAVDVLINCGFVPVFRLTYPEEEFKRINKEKESTHNRGRPKKDPTRYNLENKSMSDEKLSLYPQSGEPIIYIHTLKSLINPGTTDYNVVTSYLRGARNDDKKILSNAELRIYWPSTGRWEDASLTAIEVLIPWVQKVIKTRIAQRFSGYYNLEIGGKMRIARADEDITSGVKRLRGAVCTTKKVHEIVPILYELHLSATGQEVFREQMPDPADEKVVQQDWMNKLSDPQVTSTWKGENLSIFSGPDGLPLSNITKMEFYISTGKDIYDNAGEMKDNFYLCDVLERQFWELGLVASTDIVSCLRSEVAYKVQESYKQNPSVTRVTLLPALLDFSARKQPKIITRTTTKSEAPERGPPSPRLQLPSLVAPRSGTSNFGLPPLGSGTSNFGLPPLGSGTSNFGLPPLGSGTSNFGLPPLGSGASNFGLPPLGSGASNFGLPSPRLALPTLGLKPSSFLPSQPSK